MRLLLDTHIALWAIIDDERLPDLTRRLIDDTENAVFVSAAAIWEIAIKRSLNRGILVSSEEALNYFGLAGFTMLPILPRHATRVETLPPIHADPFDRLMVAQALSEPLRLLTHDRRVAAYSDSIMLV